jgi:hypothetical protein
MYWSPSHIDASVTVRGSASIREASARGRPRSSFDFDLQKRRLPAQVEWLR